MTITTRLVGALCLLLVGDLCITQTEDPSTTSAGSSAPASLPVKKLNIRDRLTLKSEDDLNSISLTGHFQLDNDFYDGTYNVRGNGGSSENEIRRARFGVDGRIEGDWQYEFLLNVDDEDAIIFEAIPHNDVSQLGVMLDHAFLGGFHYDLGVFDANVEDIKDGKDQYGLYGRLTLARGRQRQRVRC